MFITDTAMSNRGGVSIKNVITAVFMVASLYLLYIYNGSQNRLHESEMTGARYRRESEDRVSEIQELNKGKDDLQERCENDKRELANRIKSINQQLSMLQSQHKEMEADFMKLKQDMETMRSEHMQAESQHAQEYQDLKMEKDRSISGLEEDLKLSKKTNDDLQVSLDTLRAEVHNRERQEELLNGTKAQLQSALLKLQNFETVQQSLRDQNTQLHLKQYQQQQLLEQKEQQQQQLRQQQQQPQQAQQQQQQAQDAQQQQLQQQQLQDMQQQQQQFDQSQNAGVQAGQGQDGVDAKQQQDLLNNGLGYQGGHLVQNMKIPDGEVLTNNGMMLNAQAQQVNQAQGGLANNEGVKDQVQDQKNPQLGDVNIDALNAQHQVLPPNDDNNNLINDIKNDDSMSLGEKRPDVNPNDLQKGQILEPIVDAAEDKNNANGGEDGAAHNSIREAEQKREQEELDNTLIEHKNPLALGQMQQPGDLHHFEGEGEGIGQQRAPVNSNEEDKNADKNDQQLYYQDDVIDKFLREGNQDFDEDEDTDVNNNNDNVLNSDDGDGDNAHDGLDREELNAKMEPGFNKGNDLAHIPQFNNILPNLADPREEEEEEDEEGNLHRQWFNAEARDEDYGVAKKIAGHNF